MWPIKLIFSRIELIVLNVFMPAFLYKYTSTQTFQKLKKDLRMVLPKYTETRRKPTRKEIMYEFDNY